MTSKTSRTEIRTKIFDIAAENHETLSQLAGGMKISVSQIYRVREGTRRINAKFIVGAMKAFPGSKFEDLFYLDER